MTTADGAREGSIENEVKYDRLDDVADRSPKPVTPDETHERRLHPLTLLYRAVLSLPGFFFLLYPAFREQDLTAYTNLIMAAVYGVLVLPWIVLYYRRFRYSISPKEVVIRKGILTREDRSIPIERIQNVEIVRRLLARALGIAQVRIETGGSATTEGSLEYVSVAEALRVRTVIRSYQAQHRSGIDGESGILAASTEPSAAEPIEVSLHNMAPREVVLSGAFRVSLAFVAIVFASFQYLGIREEEIIMFVLDNLGTVQETVSTGFVTAITLFAAVFIGWLTSMLASISKYWKLSLTLEGRKLHRRHGLLTRLEGTLPLDRIHVLMQTSNAPMRWFGYAALEAQTMGADTQQPGKQVLLPLSETTQIHQTARQIGLFEMPDEFQKVSPLMIRRQFIRMTAVLTLACLPLARYFLGWEILWLLLLLPGLLGLAYMQYRVHGYGWVPGAMVVRRGLWNQKIWVIPVRRLQTLSSISSIFQRRLGLCSLWLDTAGGDHFSPAYIRDLPFEVAEGLFRELSESARHAGQRDVNGRLLTSS